MFELNEKQVLMIGLDGPGQAACGLLRRAGAVVVAVDSANTEALREVAGRLRSDGVQVELGVSLLPKRNFDLAVVGPSVAPASPLLQAAFAAEIPVISELEL